jgi:hemolysin activation/secretion protein
MIKKQSIPYWLLVAGAASLNVQAAPALPDSGQIMREQKMQRDTPPPKADVQIKNETDGQGEDAAPKSGAALDMTPIPVSAIQVTGNNVFASPVLEALVTDLIGNKRTLAELEAGAARITAFYRARGYFLASAYIPAQDIKDGLVKFAVQEGKLDELRLNNNSRVSDERVKGFVTGLKGDALQTKPLDRKLLLLRDTVGVGGVRATLQPGTSAGTSDLLMETSASDPYNFRMQLDNFGNYYTGVNRLNTSLAINSPLGIGDQLSARLIGSRYGMTYARGAYQLPIGSDGLRAGVAYSESSYELGRSYKWYGIEGTARSGSIFTTYPFVMSQTGSLIGSLTYEDRSLTDTDITDYRSKKDIKLLNFGLLGNHQDTLNGAGLTSFDLSLVVGDLNLDRTSRINDDASARSNGAYTKAAYMVNRLQRVTDNDTVSASVSGQWAGDNLNSSDKYSLGGVYGVRAYPQGEAVGDEGTLVNLELRHRFHPQVQGVLFYDYGHVKINHDNFTANFNNTRTLAGAGFGVNAEIYGMQLNSYVAWRTQGGSPVSEPASAESTPQFWVQLSSDFEIVRR